jgi:sulfate adenylyltransferase subunit 2
MNHLDEIESESIYILREAFNRVTRLSMLWSVGKDSNVLIWLAKKAFFGHVPFPVINIDTGKKMPEMYAFRDAYGEKWGLDLVVVQCPPIETVDPTLPPATRSAARKTAALKQIVAERQFDGVIAGIRRDEEGTRAKERVFSPRDNSGHWDYRDQPPEFWDQYNAEFRPGTHVRIHPLLHWTELDIWHYIEREQIPVVDLYFARHGKRYRSLGDNDITFPVASNATTIAQIIVELSVTRVAERSGRAMDHESEDSFERLRSDGYM